MEFMTKYAEINEALLACCVWLFYCKVNWWDGLDQVLWEVPTSPRGGEDPQHRSVRGSEQTAALTLALRHDGVWGRGCITPCILKDSTRWRWASVFCDTAPCSVVKVDRRFRDRPHDGGSKHFWNVALFIRDYTAQICKDCDLNDFSITTINFPLNIAVISRYFIAFMKCQYLFIFTEISLIH